MGGLVPAIHIFGFAQIFRRMAEPTGPTRMGGFVNGKVTCAAALLDAGVVLVLKMVLIAQTIGLQIPGLSAAG
jgi:hypothetical protein